MLPSIRFTYVKPLLKAVIWQKQKKEATDNQHSRTVW